MGRRRSSSISIDVDASDVIDQISDEVILEEIEARRLQVPTLLGCDETAAEAAITALRQGRSFDALTILERTLYPKFQSQAACAKALLELMQRAA